MVVKALVVVVVLLVVVGVVVLLVVVWVKLVGGVSLRVVFINMEVKMGGMVLFGVLAVVISVLMVVVVTVVLMGER